MNNLTSAQLLGYRDRINSGGVSGAREVYADLHDQGYGYAGWAEGVATGNTVTGQSALDFLNSTALLGMGGEACRNLTTSQVDQIRTDMALGYINKLIDIADKNNGILNRDVNFRETADFHRAAFERNSLTLENWTLNTPMELIQQEKGDEAVEGLWARIRDTGGGGPDALAASMALAQMMGRLLYSPDASLRNAAAEWMDGSCAWNGQLGAI